MSDSDSFINEVTEEVRREKLFGYLRRYGWIAVLAVLLIVGGAAFNEYRNVQARETAQATGDALMAALEIDDAAQRAEAITAAPAQGSAAAVTQLLTAATQEEAGDYAAAAATLDALIVNADVPQMYRDLAAFKSAMMPIEDTAARKSALEALSAPGMPFALLAQEQLAHIALTEGDEEGALALLRGIEEDAGATRSLRERAQNLMVALGEPLPETVVE